MSKVKQQHYVPRFHLRRFADEREQIHVYDKKEMRSFVTGIQNVAAEHGFLDLPQLESHGLSGQFMEKEYLAAFESEGAVAIGDIVKSVESGTFRRLRGKRRAQLARFVAIQSMRTREHREAISTVAGLIHEVQFRSHLETIAPERANDPFYVRPGPEAERAYHIQNLLDLPLIETIVRALLAHLWRVMRAPVSSPLWTSDNPVVRHGHIKDQHRGTNGFASRGVEIAFPLSPRLTISAAEASYFFMVAKGRGELRDLLPENVTFYNSLQVLHSSRFLFSMSGDFSLAESMCKERPHLRDPDRPRIEVGGGPWCNLGGGSREELASPKPGETQAESGETEEGPASTT